MYKLIIMMTIILMNNKQCIGQSMKTEYLPTLNRSITTFSDGSTAKTDYLPSKNKSITTFSDGTTAKTDYLLSQNTSITRFDDGSVIKTIYQPTLNSSLTTFSDGTTAKTNFLSSSNSSITTFSDGSTVTTRYLPLLNKSISTINKVFTSRSINTPYKLPLETTYMKQNKFTINNSQTNDGLSIATTILSNLNKILDQRQYQSDIQNEQNRQFTISLMEMEEEEKRNQTFTIIKVACNTINENNSRLNQLLDKIMQTGIKLDKLNYSYLTKEFNDYLKAESDYSQDLDEFKDKILNKYKIINSAQESEIQKLSDKLNKYNLGYNDYNVINSIKRSFQYKTSPYDEYIYEFNKIKEQNPENKIYDDDSYIKGLESAIFNSAKSPLFYTSEITNDTLNFQKKVQWIEVSSKINDKYLWEIQKSNVISIKDSIGTIIKIKGVYFLINPPKNVKLRVGQIYSIMRVVDSKKKSIGYAQVIKIFENKIALKHTLYDDKNLITLQDLIQLD
jgi:hypothetical protein